MEKILEKILHGIDKVPKLAHPGSLIVYEPNCYPILTGDESTSVVFACAEYGKGRVFVCAHEIYVHKLTSLPELEAFWKNIKTWLVANEKFEDSDIVDVSQIETVSDLNDIKLVKWTGSTQKSELFINQFVKKYVFNGGSVLCGQCAWEWLSINRGKSVNDMSLNVFLNKLGITYTNTISSINSNFINVNRNLIFKSHFGNTVLRVETNKVECLESYNLLINGILNLPFKHLEKLYQILYNYIVSEYKPTYKTHVECSVGVKLLSICSHFYLKFPNLRAPNIEEFPGSYSTQPNLVSAEFSLKSKFDEFHCTGFYIGPGLIAKINVLEGNPSGWSIRIGSHTDDLSEGTHLKRWPLTSSSLKLRKETTISTGFGGLIYLESPKGSSSLKIKLENVIESPFYDLNDPERIQNWDKNRFSKGLWAELSGKHITFNVPSESIRNLKDPSESLKLWDSIVASYHELRGTDVNNTWKERVVVDIQPFGELMHSGYPVVIPYGYANILFEPKEILVHGWNVVHELGHNMQRHFWTPSRTEEIWANLFALHAYESIFKQKTWSKILTERFDKQIMFEFESTDFEFDKWIENPSLGLYLFAQLVNAFGWNSFKLVFREYETLVNNENIFKSDLNKWDQFIIRFSNIVGLNVAPLFYFWGIKYSDKSGTSLNDLTAWLPNDEIIKLFPNRVKYCRKNFNFLITGNESQYTSFIKE